MAGKPVWTGRLVRWSMAVLALALLIPARITMAQGGATEKIITAANVGSLVQKKVGLGDISGVIWSGGTALVSTAGGLAIAYTAGAETGAAQPSGTLIGTENASRLRVIPGGRVLAVVPTTRTLRYYEAATGALIGKTELGGKQSTSDRFQEFSFDVSVDGKRLVLSNADEMIEVWNIETVGKAVLVGRWERGGAGGALYFAANDTHVMDFEYRQFRLYDLLSGKLIVATSAQTNQNYSYGLVNDNATYAALAKTDLNVQSIDLKTGKVTVIRARGDANNPYSTLKQIVFTPTGTIGAVVTQRGTVTLWDARTGKTLPAPPPVSPNSEIQFNPAGDRLLFTVNETLTAWDWTTRKSKVIAAQANLVRVSAGRALATYGNIVKWFDIETGTQSDAFNVPGAVLLGASISADGRYAAAWNDTLYLIDLETGKTITQDTDYFTLRNAKPIPNKPYLIQSGPALLQVIDPLDGSVILSVPPKRQQVGENTAYVPYIVAPNGALALATIQTDSATKTNLRDIFSVELTPGGVIRKVGELVSGEALEAVDWEATGDWITSNRERGLIMRWDAKTGAQKTQIETKLYQRSEQGQYRPTEFTPDGGLVFGFERNGATISLNAYDTRTGALRKTLITRPNTPSVNVFLSNDGGRLAAFLDGWSALWNAETLEQIAVVTQPRPGHPTGGRIALVFSPKGRYLLQLSVGGNNGVRSLMLCETATGKQTEPIYYSKNARGFSTPEMRFTPDETELVIVDSAARSLVVIETATGTIRYEEPEDDNPDNPFMSAALNPTGDVLALLMEDGTLIFRDPKTHQELSRISRTRREYVQSFRFNGDGSALLIDYYNGMQVYGLL